MLPTGRQTTLLVDALDAAALRNPTAKMVLPHLGTVRETSSEKAQKLLGWSPRPFEDAVVATAESLLKLGLA